MNINHESKKVKYRRYIDELYAKRYNATSDSELESIEQEALKMFFKTNEHEYILLAKKIEREICYHEHTQ